MIVHDNSSTVVKNLMSQHVPKEDMNLFDENSLISLYTESAHISSLRRLAGLRIRRAKSRFLYYAKSKVRASLIKSCWVRKKLFPNYSNGFVLYHFRGFLTIKKLFFTVWLSVYRLCTYLPRDQKI